jgi:hypothetical protein
MQDCRPVDTLPSIGQSLIRKGWCTAEEKYKGSKRQPHASDVHRASPFFGKDRGFGKSAIPGDRQ